MKKRSRKRHVSLGSTVNRHSVLANRAFTQAENQIQLLERRTGSCLNRHRNIVDVERWLAKGVTHVAAQERMDPRWHEAAVSRLWSRSDAILKKFENNCLRKK